MKKIFLRSFACFLATLFVLPLFLFLPVAAEDEETRFVFDSLSAQGEKAYPFSNEPVSLSLSKTEYSFTANALRMIEEQGNAFYISLINMSTATALQITYTYTEAAEQKQETLSCTLKAGDPTVQTLTLSGQHISKSIQALSLTFLGEGELSGTVTLQAMFDFITYVPERYVDHAGEPLAKLTSCYYNASAKNVEIVGEISHTTTANFPREDYYLALFALSAGEDLYLSRKTPLVRSEMAMDFSFSVPVETADDLYARYVVAAVDRRQGASAPLCAPTYPSLSAGELQREDGFKGFHTPDLSALMDSTPGTEFVDVYLNRLQSVQNNGILYVGEYSYYYFDEAYVNEIDRLVRNLTGIGCHVYLRFLIDPDANNLSFADFSDEESGAINKMPTVRTIEAQRDLHAVTDFLCARYATQSIGRISGIVLGHAADSADSLNYADVANLSEYAALYATTLHLIAATARTAIPGISVVMPLSNQVFDGGYTESTASGSYTPALFLPALISAMQAQCLSQQPFSVMLETSETPDKISGMTAEGYGIDSLSAFLELISSNAKRASFLQTSVFYAWTPSATLTDSELKAAYLLQYLTLFENENVVCFMTDLSLAEEDAVAAMSAALSFLVRFVDTDKLESAASSALRLLGVKTVQELVDALNVNELQKRKVHHFSLQNGDYASGATPTGSYRMWNFKTATTTLDWYAGAGCQAISVISDSSANRSLVAELSGKESYSDIAYHFNSAVDLAFAPLLAMELTVQGSAQSRYEVQLRLVGDEDIVISSAIVHAGEEQRLQLDLSGKENALSHLRSVRVAVRPLDGNTDDFKVFLYAFDLESDKLTDEQLEQRVNAIRESTSLQQEEEEKKRDITLPLVVTAIVVMASAAVVVMVLIRYKSKRRRMNNDEEG